MADTKSLDCTKKIRAVRIELEGVVQGIGFRPFVYRLAEKHGISGGVKNRSGLVEIFAQGSPGPLSSFLDGLLREPPAHAEITAARAEDIPVFSAEGFKIEDSGGDFTGSRFFAPDLALCEACRGEIQNPEDRRRRHFFNNCVSCGPRFSVLRSFPYDRENTSMDAFGMCPDCAAEYAEPSGRRFHAETIACNNCGPVLFYRRDNTRFAGEQAFCEAVGDLRDGGVAAIKGIGGYHFACSPYISSAVKSLRELKGRENKPFAVMFKDMDEILEVCEASEAERGLLSSPARPIVLLRMKNRPFARETLYDNDRCGCFLPYTPLHELILAEIPRLIMTSANVSGSPIIKDEREIFAICRAVLYNNREIIRGVEDSVAQAASGKTQIIRRARGYVPVPLELENPRGLKILAMGGDLKASFSLSDGKRVIMSQYFGDLENAGVSARYTEGADDFIGLFDIRPEIVACDLHPRYFSARIAERLSKRFNVPLLRVPHHHAHIASVIAEHRLSGRVIGVAFDGSGYGNDGNIWGGEFLVCEGGGFRRAGHLEYTALLGADGAAADAQKTAACFLYQNGILPDHPAREIIAAALEHSVNTFLSSSVGRIFDAVAALTGVCPQNRYEGECASALERLARQEYESGRAPAPVSLPYGEENGLIVVRHGGMIKNAYYSSKRGDFSPGAFALGFHTALADAVCGVCRTVREKEETDQVALSGGVFQNSLLLTLCMDKLTRNGFRVFINSAVPPNDGGLALGQSYIAANSI